MQKNMIDISEKDKAIIGHILQTSIPNMPVYAFGSRVTGNAKAYSDLDLVVMGELDLSQLAALKDAFDASDLVYKVDISDWASLSDDFKNRIKPDLVQFLSTKEA